MFVKFKHMVNIYYYIKYINYKILLKIINKDT